MTDCKLLVRGSNYFVMLAAKRADDPGFQLACSVLAEHCMYEWSGGYGGPSSEMVELAERVVGRSLDSVLSELKGIPLCPQ